jgi:hypothetical protein
MKFNSSKALAILFLVIVSSCSSNPKSSTMNTEYITATTVSSYQLRLNQSAGWVKRTLESYIEVSEKALQSRNKSLYSSGETPSTILVCSMNRFAVAFESLDDYTVIDNYDEVKDLFPLDAMMSWIKTCSGVF